MKWLLSVLMIALLSGCSKPLIWTLPAITLGSIALSIPLTMNLLWNSQNEHTHQRSNGYFNSCNN